MQIISEKLEVESEIIKFKEIIPQKPAEAKIQLEKDREEKRELKLESKEQHLGMARFGR